MKMNPGKGQNKEIGGCFLMIPDNLGQFPVNGIRYSVFMQLHIGADRVISPPIIKFSDFFQIIKGNQDVERQRAVFRRFFNNTRNGKFIFIIYQ